MRSACEDSKRDGFWSTMLPNRADSEHPNGLPRYAAEREDYPDFLAVLLPAEWIYLSWATAHEDQTPKRFYLAEWIALHTLPEVQAFVAWLRAEIDRHGPALAPAR